jgi:quinol monooxygenase YgiN
MSIGREQNLFIYVMKIVIKPHKTAEFENALYSISHNFLKAKGCLGYTLHRFTEKKDSFMVVGEWKTHQTMEKHFQTHEFELLIGAARVLGETFEMNIAEVLKTGGFELAREQIASQ